MRFRYLTDPLFLVCLTGYFVNRWFIKPHVHGGFFHDSFNDVICIPFWIPIMLWGMRRLGLRKSDDAPSWLEIMVPVLLWSYIFEVWLPHVRWMSKPMIGDPGDILSYASGALLAMLFWDWWYSTERGRHQLA